jgi:hypothetical protein
MKPAIAKEWLWLLSMFILGAIVAPLILYGITTYHFDYTSSVYVDINTFMQMPVSDEPGTIVDSRFLYDSMRRNGHPISSYNGFVKQIADSNYRRTVFSLLAEDHTSSDYRVGDNYMIVEKRWRQRLVEVPTRIVESGYKLFFNRIAQPSHYLLLIAPYIICIFCRFTYWSVRTALARRVK